MLAHSNPSIQGQPNIEAEICKWTADGYSYLVGFMATGSFSAEFTMYINDEPWYVYQTSPGNRTAYVADRATKLAAGTIGSLRVKHNDSSVQDFKGTILGGK
jgi:hypothetical protein